MLEYVVQEGGELKKNKNNHDCCESKEESFLHVNWADLH